MQLEEKLKNVKYLNKIIKDKYDLVFLIIFLLSIILNIYFLTYTYKQPLWFDEADYLNFGKYVANGFPEWQLGPVRPPLFPLITALFFKIGLGEIGLRILILISYLSNILLTYLIGKELLDKKTGIIASIVSAVFWSYLFSAHRLLVDLPALTFWLLTTYFFIYGHINKKSKIAEILIIPSLVIGFFFKYLNAPLAVILILYMLITKKLNFLKNKNLWTSTIIGMLMFIPFLIFQYIYFKNPFAFLTASLGDRTTLGRTFLDFLILDIKQLFSPNMIGWIFLVLSIIGIICLLEIFIGFDLIIKNKNNNLSKKLFLFLWFLGTLIFVSKLGYGYYFEERLAFNFLASLFIIIGLGASFTYNLIKKYNKILAITLISIILLIGAYENLTKADLAIKSKAESFIQVKQAGEFLESHLKEDEGYLSPATSAEIQYHSNRQNFAIDIEEALKNPKIKYAVISGFNEMPEKYKNYIQENQNKFKPVEVYTLDKEGKQPIVIIFEIIRN